MTFSDTARLALRNLRQAKLRTSLTTLGVSIGIASLAGMVSLGVGLQDQFVDRFTKSGMFDSINVMGAGDLPGLLARGGGARAGQGARQGRRGRGSNPASSERTLTDETLKELAALEHVREVYPNLRIPLEVTLDGHSEFSTAAGVPRSAKDLGAFQTIAHGAFFGSDSDTACMLSLDMARRLTEGEPAALIAKEVTLTYAVSPPAAAPAGNPLGSVESTLMQVRRIDAKYKIVGIVEREAGPPMGGATVSPVMIPMGRALSIHASAVSSPRALMGGTANRSYPMVTVKVTQAQHTQDVQARIRGLGYSAFSLSDALQGAKRALIILDIVLSLIGSIALAVASLGIVNTMVMSILERTREIGIMKAIGGSDGDIRRIFLIEAAAIGLMGGLAGVALGWLVGRVINFGAQQVVRVRDVREQLREAADVRCGLKRELVCWHLLRGPQDEALDAVVGECRAARHRRTIDRGRGGRRLLRARQQGWTTSSACMNLSFLFGWKHSDA